MRETCYFCYYHSFCDRSAVRSAESEYPVCENWKPMGIPKRAIKHYYDEFLVNALKSISHCYPEKQAASLSKYLIDMQERINNALDYYSENEVAIPTKEASASAWAKKYYAQHYSNVNYWIRKKER